MEIAMTVEDMIYLIQQAGAVLLVIILIYLVQQWIGSSRVNDEQMRITLQEAKILREVALERSTQILSKANPLNNLEVVPVVTRNGLNGNKLQSIHVKYAAKMSNAFKESEAMPGLSDLNHEGKRVL